jgi:hypothetical protein
MAAEIVALNDHQIAIATHPDRLDISRFLTAGISLRDKNRRSARRLSIVTETARPQRGF